MFTKILQIYEVFKKENANNPLYETLRIVDLLSKGALRNIDLSLLDEKAIGLQHFIQKRKEGMPLEYIIGKASFMGYTFFCSQDTLIPTEETSLLVETALDFIKSKQKFEKELTVIDMGTGCGNIAISIALGSTDIKILASDVSHSAIEVARKNVNKFDLKGRVSLFCGDLFSPFQELGYEGKIDLVICNPPYIPTGSLKKLSSEIVDYEPIVALDAGPYGINIYRRLIADSLLMLKHKGTLVFEIGEGQEKLVGRLLDKHGGYEDIKFFKHEEQIRVISAFKKG